MFKKLCLLAVITALCVVVLGAYVRLSDAGLGCPDWPGCFGALSVPQSESAIAHAQTTYPDKPIEAAKAWKEMVHRYLAASLGLMVLALFILAWKRDGKVQVSPWLTTLLLGLIVFQAALGMWTVTLLLKPVIVTSHLLGGMATLAILTWIAHRHWGTQMTHHKVSAMFSVAIRFGLLVLFGQLFLGGWTSTNYAALACTDFPTCHGSLIPSMDFYDAFHMYRELGKSMSGGNLSLSALSTIQWTHRIGAIVVFVYIGLLAWSGLKYMQLRGLCIALFLALVLQVSLGIANLVLQLPLVLAVAHNLGAAILVILMVLLNSKITTNRYR
jgi:heme a synthase